MKQSLYSLMRRQSWLYDRDHDSMRKGYRDLVHGILRVTTRAAGLRYRLLSRGKDGDLLNLGSGRTPIPGWINTDINPFSGAELWMDLRDRWPIADDTVSVVYSRHCMEHFDEKDLSAILRQCYRVLKPGGGIRIGVPSLETAIQQYLRGDFSFAGWLDQSEPKAKTFIRYITDNGNHPILLDFEYVGRILSAAGFADVTRSAGGDSRIVDSAKLPPGDSSADWVTLYVEARKPAAS
jgi:predicted SAM-dependent methyltransferase